MIAGVNPPDMGRQAIGTTLLQHTTGYYMQSETQLTTKVMCTGAIDDYAQRGRLIHCVLFDEALNTGLQPSRRRNYRLFYYYYLQNTAPYKQLCWNLSIKLVRLDWSKRETHQLPASR